MMLATFWQTVSGVQEVFRREPMLLLGVVAILGHYFGGLARRVRLPSIIGFMVLGVLLGPSVVGFFEESNGRGGGNLDRLSFVTEVALGFVAFTIGSELNLRSLRQLGGGIISIIFAESFGAFFVVTGLVYLVTGSWAMAILFGSVAPASAPAGTVAVIQECRAQGNLTKALYAVVGFDDGLAILIFGFAAAMAKTMLLSNLGVAGGGDGILAAMKQPLLEIVGSTVVGVGIGFVFCQLIKRLQTSRDMLIMTFGAVLVTTGLSVHFHLSLILTNMVVGFILVNTRREALVRQVAGPLTDILPLLFVLFFCLAGAHLKISSLPQLGVVGVVYIIGRTVGLIGGARLGAMVGGVDEKVKKYVGLGILSQAGVAIGLSLIVSSDFHELAARPDVAAAVRNIPLADRVLYDPMAMGAALITTITATCIFFEIIGPILTKIALVKAGEIPQARPGGKGAGSGGTAGHRS